MTRYLAIPGAVLLVGGFGRAAVNVQWDPTAAVVAASGAVVSAAAALLNWRHVLEWLRDPRGVYAVTTGISVALFLAALIMLNIAVWYNPWTVDLTAAGLNRLSGEARGVLRQLGSPVSLQQFGLSRDPRLEKLLQNFGRESPRVRVEFVDIDRERVLTSRYGITRPGTVVVAAGERFRKIESPNEPSLLTALRQVTADKERVVCFVGGHGERGIADKGPTGLASLAAILTAAAYEPRSISLLEETVPAFCEAVVVAGARQDFLPDEQTRLEAYHAGGGRIALLLEPDPAPSFAAWLRARGIDPRPGEIVDTSGAGRQLGAGVRAPLALEYPDHPVTRDFNFGVLFDGARPLEIISPAFGAAPRPLARTGRKSFVAASGGTVPAFDAARNTAGPLTLAAASSADLHDDEGSRLVVLGDVDFVSNAHLRLPANRDFFLRALSWLLGEAESAIVAVPDRDNRRVALTEQMRARMYIVNVIVLPLVPLLGGVIVYWRRRRQG
jgi:hypothetical protein